MNIQEPASIVLSGSYMPQMLGILFGSCLRNLFFTFQKKQGGK